ncbi:MAG: MFS transporter [Fimbriimonadales bacterium]
MRISPTHAALIAIFLDLTGFGMMFPDVQLRGQELGIPGWRIGAILASYYIIQFVLSPFWGRLSDDVGRRKILLVCTGLSAVAMFAYGLLPGEPALWAGRVLAGFGAGNVAIAQAFVADAAESKYDRARALGLMGAVVSAGLVLGPVVGALAVEIGGKLALGVIAGGLSSIGGLLILAKLAKVPAARSDQPARVGFSLIAKSSILRSLFLVAILGWFALACLEGTFGRYLEWKFGFGRMEFGAFLALEAAVAFLQGFTFPALSKKLSNRAILYGSFALQAIGFVLIPLAPSIPMLIVASILFGVGLGLSGPAINVLAVNAALPNVRGGVLGTLQGARAAGFFLGPIVAGGLFDAFPPAPYYLAAALATIATLAAMRLKDEITASRSPEEALKSE